jgi:hypothetical protein
MFRPIDNQVTLAADMMRNNAAIVRQGETAQAYQAVQAKATAEREKQSITKLSENGKAQIQNDNEGGQGQQYESVRFAKPKPKKTALADSEDNFVFADPNGEPTIDISI